jgi:hypothetical protein
MPPDGRLPSRARRSCRVSRLHRLFAQQVLRQREHAEQLAVEVVAVGDDDDGRVFHRHVLHHAGGEAGHRDALAAALGVPHHAALAAGERRAVGSRRGHHLADRRAHRVELVVAGDLLHQPAIVFEQHEEAQIVEQHRRREHAAHQRFEFVELAQRVEHVPVDGAPLHEALRIGRQRTEPRLAAVGNHQQFVVLEHVRDLRLVGLDLVVGLPDAGGWSAGFFSSSSTSGSPLTNRITSGRRVCFGPLIVNCRIASHSLHAGSAQSISRTKSPRVSPSCWYSTGTPPMSSR